MKARKLITRGEEARKKLYAGVDILADSVGSTLGAKGQTVLYQHEDDVDGVVLVTKDGVTVAKQIQLDDPVENMGANLIKESAKATVQRAGDGTTTATVLTQAILKEAGLNTSLEMIKGITAANEAVEEYIENEAKEVEGVEMLKFVANVSTNNDDELGTLVSDAIEKAGEHGTVGWEVNLKSTETYVKIEDGAVIPRGYIDPGFINNEEKKLMQFENPYVFVSTAQVQDIDQIRPVLEKAITENRPAVFIADFEPDIAANILKNVKVNGMKLGIVPCPSFGPLKQEMMEDIADLVGVPLHGHHIGDAEENLLDFMGTCNQLVSTNGNTILRFEEKPDLSEKVSNIQSQLKGEETSMRKRQLKERMAMLAGSIGQIYIWAPSEIELKEKYDRIEDAVYAVYAAKEEGILPGGGVALRDAAESLGLKKEEDDYSKGWNSYLRAMHAPYNKILDNAGLYAPENTKKGFGVNVLTEDIVDMEEAGIIDPAKITKQALKNATSVAKTILGTNVVINNIE